MHEQATAGNRPGTRRPRRTTRATTTGHRDYRKTTMPGVYERGAAPDRYWSVRYTDAEGKRRTEGPFPKFKDACAFKAKVTQELEDGTHRRIEPTTFKEYAEAWPDRYRGRTTTAIRPATRERYRQQVAVAVDFLAGRSGRRPLAAITPQDIERYIDHLYLMGHKPKTISRYVTALKAMFSQAVREGRIPTNPATGVPLLPTDPAMIPDADDEAEAGVKALSPDEIVALIAALPGHHRLQVSLIARTGLRISEVLGLRWQDLDREEGVIRVRQAVVGGKVGKPKTKRSRRSIPVGDDLMRDLLARRLAAKHSADDDLVFGTRSGKPVDVSSCYDWLIPAAEAAGVPWARFHALRHGAATAWFAAGVPITVVSALLGHSTASFTLSVYTHAMPDHMPDGATLATAVGL
jgi:integrase